jgi:hypothetical protein
LRSNDYPFVGTDCTLAPQHGLLEEKIIDREEFTVRGARTGKMLHCSAKIP